VERIGEYLKLAGKGGRKAAAVFCGDPAHIMPAVRHLRRGAPDVPVFLFTTGAPPEEASRLCERVFVDGDPMALAVRAQQELWPFRVALCVVGWTGRCGNWPLKLVPFLVPPFRVLVMNAAGDFFNATPATVGKHIQGLVQDCLHSGWNRLKDIHRGAWLWVFAWIAQWFSGLSRFAFERWHGAEPLQIPALSPEDGGIEAFTYSDRHWERDRLRRVIDAPGSRWILFLQDRGGAALDQWLPLFDDPRTFAVTLQTRSRGWHPGLFPVAPFRRLQPGEVSQVLAPVSPVILVDRAKLRALGLPRTAVPGSAFYLWFWQAAAAGWRSYSAGAEAEVEDVTEWPYEEAEFVTRVLAEPGLRRLGPREPSLARGSIGFALPPRCAAGPRPRVLVVSPYVPYPLSHGGAVRIYNLCRALAPKVDFLLACFREQNDAIPYDKLHNVFREVYAVDFDERPSQDLTLPKQAREHASSSMAALIEEVRRARGLDLVQVEYTHMARFREAAGERALLVEHDLTFTLYQQLGDAAEAARWLALERAAFHGYTAIWTMSGHDRARALQEGAAPERTFIVPNGVDLARFQPGDASPDTPEVLYVGSFRHLPNVLGYRKLRDEIMPSVWRRAPDTVLRVVAGPEPEKYDAAGGRDKRIVLHAFVEDLRPLYARAAVVAVPLLVSAGTNIKVMEAMACQKAVVTTPVGCVGLGLVDGADACIREDAAAFADAVVDLLRDEPRRSRIAREARRTVQRRFSWKSVADSAFASYERLW
jgi:glycosyltransferase involved in cell wall biosynthesis